MHWIFGFKASVNLWQLFGPIFWGSWTVNTGLHKTPHTIHTSWQNIPKEYSVDLTEIFGDDDVDDDVDGVEPPVPAVDRQGVGGVDEPQVHRNKGHGEERIGQRQDKQGDLVFSRDGLKI